MKHNKFLKILICLLGLGVTGCSCHKSTIIEKKDIADKKDNKKTNPSNNQIITDDARQKASELNYFYNPTGTIVKQKDSYDLENYALSILTDTKDRNGHHIIYSFEGSHREVFSGEYITTYGHLYLWDDEYVCGKICDKEVKGYWYNSSISRGVDSSTGLDKKDEIVIITDDSINPEIHSTVIYGGENQFEEITVGFIGAGNATRYLLMQGRYYYPEVALSIVIDESIASFKVGKPFISNGIDVYKIYSNLSYKLLLNYEYEFYFGDDACDSNGCFIKPGEFDLIAAIDQLRGVTKITVTY